jgi:beta-fructofuranosidase
LDKAGTRIVWGWVPEARPEQEYSTAGWAGLMSLPRVLTLAENGRLEIDVLDEAKQLRIPQDELHLAEDEEHNRRQIASMRIKECRGEILGTAHRGHERIELTLSGFNRTNSWFSLKYDPRHPGQVSINGQPIPVSFGESDNLNFHLYVDGSVIETFVNGQVACTKRFYVPGDGPQDLHLQWVGKTSTLVSLSVWQLSPISNDRLTA